ncbi:MAG: SGNH/GDSL hydrolase family protein [Bacteroidota bacterium]
MGFEPEGGSGGSGGSSFQIATAGGTADAITATYTTPMTLTDKAVCAFVASAANTSATPTFAPDGLTAHTITKNGGAVLVAGDIPAALAVVILEYNLANTRWEIIGMQGDTLVTEGGLINSATSKAAPVDADYVGLMDSAAGNILKKVSWANVKSTLSGVFQLLSEKNVANGYAGLSSLKTIDPEQINGFSYGNIITETFSSLANFTQTGSAFSAVGGVCEISSAPGAISFASYIRQTAYGNSDLENTTTTADLTVGTISATSFGVGFGYKSNGGFFQKSLTVAFLMDSTNKGKIAFYFDNAVTGGVVSSSSITIASGDVTTIKIKQNKGLITATWTNGTQIMSSSYLYYGSLFLLNPTFTSILPNAFNYSIYALGGSTHKVDNYLVNNDEKIGADLLIVGDSICKGYNMGDFTKRPADIISANSQWRCAVVAGANDLIEDMNAAEIINLAPVRILLSIGTNNLGNGDSAATVMTKLATLIASFTGAGYVLGTTLFITTLRPRTTFDVNATNALIRSTYTTSFIELYYPMWNGTSFIMNTAYASTDSLHPNELGARIEAGLYINYFGIKTKSSFGFSNGQVLQDPNGNTGIGRGNIGAKYTLDVYNSNNGSAIRFGSLVSGSTDGGGFLTSTVTNDAWVSAGLSFVGNSWIAKATSYSVVGQNAGSILFYGVTGATIGATQTLTALATITPTGRMFIGGSTAPTARMHLAAGTATASTSPLKFTSGTSLTTAEAGSMEYNGTNLFFTRAGTTRESVICANSVNSVSPTLPNRTITVVIDGVTLYLSAKTTND